MDGWVIKRGAELVPVPWRNGLGVTRDVVTVLADDGTLRWQVSIAELERDAPFSHFPHCDRVFTPIEGDPPPELAFEGGPFTPCPLLVPKRFSGEVRTLSRIPAPGRAFNAVVDRRHHTVSVRVVELDAGEDVPVPAAAELLLYCHRGALAIGPDRVAAGDTVVGRPSAASAICAATAIVVAIDPT